MRRVNSERTLGSSDRSDRSPLLHVLEGDARPGRIHRVELIRRMAGDQALVLGSLDDECRCSGFGLHAVGSATVRTLGRALTSLLKHPAADGDDSRRLPVPCAWSISTALRVARESSRVILVAEGHAPENPDPILMERLDVIVPAEKFLAGWKAVGVHRVRTLAPGALPAGATVRSDPDGAFRLGIDPDETAAVEDAILLVHRAGLMFFTGADLQIRVNRHSRHLHDVLDYGTAIGFGGVIEQLDESEFPGEVDVMFVAGCDDVATDERVLDHAARGIITIALRNGEAGPEPELTLESHGVSEHASDLTNTGADTLMGILESPDSMEALRRLARGFGSRRDALVWARELIDMLADGGSRTPLN